MGIMGGLCKSEVNEARWSHKKGLDRVSPIWLMQIKQATGCVAVQADRKSCGLQWGID